MYPHGVRSTEKVSLNAQGSLKAASLGGDSKRFDEEGLLFQQGVSLPCARCDFVVTTFRLWRNMEYNTSHLAFQDERSGI